MPTKKTVKKSIPKATKKSTKYATVKTADVELSPVSSLPSRVAIESVAFPGKFVIVSSKPAGAQAGHVATSPAAKPWLVADAGSTFGFGESANGPWLSIGPAPTCSTAVAMPQRAQSNTFAVMKLRTGGSVIRSATTAACGDMKHRYMVFDSAGRVRFSKNPPTTKTVRQYLVQLRTSAAAAGVSSTPFPASMTTTPVTTLPPNVLLESVATPGKYITLSSKPTGSNAGGISTTTVPQPWLTARSGSVFGFGVTAKGPWLSLGPGPACSTAVAWMQRKSVNQFVIAKLATGGSIIRTAVAGACSDAEYRYLAFDSAGRVRFTKTPPSAATVRQYLVHIRTGPPVGSAVPTYGPPPKYDISGYWSGNPNGSANVVITPGLGTFVDSSGRPAFVITGGSSDIYRFELTDDHPMDVRALSSDALSFPNGTTWYRVTGGGGGGPTRGPDPTAPWTSAPPGPTRGPDPTAPWTSAPPGPTRGPDPTPSNTPSPGPGPGPNPTTAAPFAPVDIDINIDGGRGGGGGFIFPVSPDLLYSGGGGIVSGTTVAPSDAPEDSSDDESDAGSGDDDGGWADGADEPRQPPPAEAVPPPRGSSLFSPKNIVFFLCILVLLGVGYWYFFKRDAAPGNNAAAATAATAAAAAGVATAATTGAPAPNAAANGANNGIDSASALPAPTAAANNDAFGNDFADGPGTQGLNSDGFDDFSDIGNIGPPPPSAASPK